MFTTMLMSALVLFSVAIALTAFRVIRGPSMPDRVVALDTIGVNLISITAVFSVLLQTTAYVDVMLIIGILAFVSTIAFSKFIERGVIIERKRDR
ncbi:Na(+)/H(+) antiporter subunit F1 [Bacillus sp. FSL W7-1360]